MHASTGKGVGLTCVKSTVRPLGVRPYLCQVGRTTIGALIPASDQLPVSGRPRRRASYPRKRGCGGQVIMCHIILSPPGRPPRGTRADPGIWPSSCLV
ncbi:hypothetical protein B296_00004311 [Ensete ventricosum]|uniref:Uncharacterized protein n=1 Tax=Ensete ventricosum TaxID=4639 RepID=A0A427AWG1_ENSVE|nr:hypothetical protein B296_00004311 [Ensete ventricosum]